MTIQEIMNKVKPIFENLPIERASIFGSYARSDNTEDSDIDIILKFEGNTYGLLFSSLRLHLAEVLGMQVDIVSENGLSCLEPTMQENIRREAICIYERKFE